MKKHNSLLKAQMFEDGTTTAISLNPVLSAAASESCYEELNFFLLIF